MLGRVCGVQGREGIGKMEGFLKLVSGSLLRPAFTAAASGIFSYANAVQQFPDSVDCLVFSAGIALGTALISEDVSGVVSTATFFGGSEILARSRGWPPGEVRFAAMFGDGPIPKATM